MTDNLFTTKFMNAMLDLGIQDEESLLFYLPNTYKNYKTPVSDIIQYMDDGEKHFFKLKLIQTPIITSGKGGKDYVKLSFSDGRNIISGMVFFGISYWKGVQKGSIVHCVAKVTNYKGVPQLSDIEYVKPELVGRIVPEYKGKEKVVSSDTISDKINIALRELLDKSVAKLERELGVPESQIVKNAVYGFHRLSDMFKALHRPSTMDDAKKASASVRLINAYHAFLRGNESTSVGSVPESEISYDIDFVKSSLTRLPFPLTKDQRKTIWEILQDLATDTPMDRLVYGDVGCGKTLSYLIPAISAQRDNKNVVILMPNALLAGQVHEECQKYFPDSPSVLMIAGVKKPVITGHEIIIGTTSIIHWMKKSNHVIDFLIVDEQQKLGVNQKNILLSKHTNFLEATATAIPKTAASVVYGNKKVSFIEECPVVKEIDSVIVDDSKKRETFNTLRSVTDSGKQIAIVYRMKTSDLSTYQLIVEARHLNKFNTKSIEEMIISAKGTILSVSDVFRTTDLFEEDSDEPLFDGVCINYKATNREHKKIIEQVKEIDEFNEIIIIDDIQDQEEIEKCKKSVENARKHWEQFYPDRVVTIHGGMNISEKIEAIRIAKAGEADVIITTSVIEIGLTMPNLAALMVLDADYYGASTLHQFRGRLSRLGGYGLFMMSVTGLISDLKDSALDRLMLLVKHKKGSKIAEDDMRQRGFGDLSKFSEKQNGHIIGLFPKIKMTPQDLDDLLKLMSLRKTA